MKMYMSSLCALMLASSVYALDSIETAKATIVTLLQQKNPAALTEFSNFFKQYDQVVTAFLDKNNNESLKSHIQHMEEKLMFLQSVCNNPQFSSVHHILMSYKIHLHELINVLRAYTRSHNLFSLGFKLRNLKFLLPTKIKQRGDFALLWALHHRLTCDT